MAASEFATSPDSTQQAIAARLARPIGRIRRALSNLLTAASLLLFIGVGVCWITSLFRTDIFFASLGTDNGYLLAEFRGQILTGSVDHPGAEELPDVTDFPPRFSHLRGSVDQMGLNVVVWLFMLGDRQSTNASIAGFGYIKQTDALDGERKMWAFFWPHWFVMIVASVAPFGWLSRWWRIKRTRRL